MYDFTNIIVISAFLQCKIIQFLLFFLLNIFFFFLNLAVFYIGENKKGQKYIYIFFFKCKNLGQRIRKPRNKKKKSPYDSFITEYSTHNIFSDVISCQSLQIFQTNAEIEEWVQENYHPNFPLFAKVNVLDDNVPEAWQYLIGKTMFS